MVRWEHGIVIVIEKIEPNLGALLVSLQGFHIGGVAEKEVAKELKLRR